MEWFKEHPNWTVFLAWIISNVILLTASFTITNQNSQVWWFILAIYIVIFYSALIWSVWVKRRSMFNLFYLLIPAVGCLIVWSLSDKRKIAEEIQAKEESDNRKTVI
jgi:membrane protein DedA with SNARE-associated domain